MSTFQNGTAPVRSTMTPTSIFDFFLSGSTSILAIFEELLACQPNSWTRMLCILGTLLYFIKRISTNICAVIEDYLS